MRDIQTLVQGFLVWGWCWKKKSDNASNVQMGKVLEVQDRTLGRGGVGWGGGGKLLTQLKEPWASMQGRHWQFYIISGSGRRKITKMSVSGVWFKIRKKKFQEAMIAEVILQKVDQRARVTILYKRCWGLWEMDRMWKTSEIMYFWDAIKQKLIFTAY